VTGPNDRGFTLIEIMIGLAITAIVMSVVYGSLRTAGRSSSASSRACRSSRRRTEKRSPNIVTPEVFESPEYLPKLKIQNLFEHFIPRAEGWKRAKSSCASWPSWWMEKAARMFTS